MSRLWPESVVAGLFPGACWLQRGSVEVARTESDAHASPQRLLEVLDDMLESLDEPLTKRARIHVLVSDSVAAVVPLPWRDLLQSAQEQLGYAHACYEQRGLQVADGWAMRAGFRRFGSVGLAWALPQSWLAQLLALLDGRGLCLVSVLPVTAAAYWRGRVATEGRRMLLLRERARLTSMLYEGGHLLSVDVQPVTGGEEASLRRLMRRLSASNEAARYIDEWCALGREGLAQPVAEMPPDAVWNVLPRLAWK